MAINYYQAITQLEKQIAKIKEEKELKEKFDKLAKEAGIEDTEAFLKDFEDTNSGNGNTPADRPENPFAGVTRTPAPAPQKGNIGHDEPRYTPGTFGKALASQNTDPNPEQTFLNMLGGGNNGKNS